MRPEEIRSHGVGLAERVRAQVDTAERLEVMLRAHRRGRVVTLAAVTAIVALAVLGVVLLAREPNPPVVTMPPTTVPSTSPQLEALPVEVFVVLYGSYSVDETSGRCEGIGRLGGIGEGAQIEVIDDSAPLEEDTRLVTLPAGEAVSSDDPETSFLISGERTTACVFALPDLGYDIDDYADVSLVPTADPEVASGSFVSGLRVVYTFRDIALDQEALSADGVASDDPGIVQAELREFRDSAGPGRIVGLVNMSAETSSGAPDSPSQPVCVGAAEFADIQPGAVVVVTDQNGQAVGESILRGSVYDGHIGCSLWFGVEVPVDLAAYSMVVAGHPPVSFDAAVLEEHGWQIDLWTDPLHMETNCGEVEPGSESMTCLLIEARE